MAADRRLRAAFIAWFVAALVVPLAVVGVARVAGALPSQAEWAKSGGNHGPWHESQVSCPHALAHELSQAPYPPEHRRCDTKVAAARVAGVAFWLNWLAIPAAAAVVLVTFVREAVVHREARRALPGILVGAVALAAWILQAICVMWVFDA